MMNLCSELIRRSAISKYYIINDKIRAKEVRVIDDDKQQLGVMTVEAAVAAAKERELDLVLISPNSTPPVCRIIDIGKYKYELSKRDKDNKKQSKAGQQVLKEVKMSPRIDEHDYSFKVKHAQEFLLKGNKVKFSIQFKGRELNHPELGDKLVTRMLEELKDYGKADNTPRLVNRLMVLVLSPVR